MTAGRRGSMWSRTSRTSRKRWTVAAGAALIVLGGCARSAPNGSAPTPAYAAHPGFDSYAYPGDEAMRAWRAPASPYRWVGYYLPAPCHRDASWSGKRATLAALGWGIAVLYVGQQTWEGQPLPVAPSAPADSTRADSTRPDSTRSDTTRVRRDRTASAGDGAGVGDAAPGVSCVPTLLGTASGIADADDAIARAAAEGFAAGTVIFLDVERMTTIPRPMREYYTAWVSRLLADGRYRPGMYAHAHNAPALYSDVAALHPTDSRGGPPFWIASGEAFAATRAPHEVGFHFASIWQGGFDATETWGGVTLRIDVNVADSPSPSTPAGGTMGGGTADGTPGRR
ncbi:MAG: glycoside hydrolase domain-containing protein [Gemmatimonadaceae bacterium]